MKSFRSLFRGYTIAIAAALLFSATAHAKANKAIVRAIRGGTAEVATDGKNFKPARVGMQLGEKAAVRTDASAKVDLFLGDNGPVVRVTEGTTLGIDRLDVEATSVEKIIDTQLDLKNGKILGNVKKMAAASKYEVKTPVGVAGIRGTEYSIDSRGRVQVFSGTVIVVYVVDGQIQAPQTIQGGSDVTPPTANGQQPTVINITTTDPTLNEIPTLIVGVTTNPDGTMSAPLLNEAGEPTSVIISTSPDGVVITPGTVGPPPVTVVVVPSIPTETQPNPSVSDPGNPISPIQPVSGSTE